MKNKIAGWARKGILAGAIALGALGYNANAGENDRLLHPRQEYIRNVLEDIELDAGIDFGFGFGVGKVKTDKNISLVPIHEEDGGEERGGVRVKPCSTELLQLRTGPYVSLGTDNVRLKTGIEGRLNLGSEMSVRELQPLPYPYESYGAISLEQDIMGFMPKAALEFEFEDIIFGVESGLPYSGFSYRAWHERYNREQTIAKDEWSGFGKMFGIYLGGKVDDTLSGHVKISREWYNPEFDGIEGKGRADIDEWIVSFGIDWRF